MNKRIIKPSNSVTMRLVKSEDLNHHGTLFAGRTAEWFVESGFIAATSLLDPKSVVCLKIHGMFFTQPARSGDVLKFSSKVVFAGRTSLTVYIHVEKSNNDKTFVEGFVTFIHVDENTRPANHYIEIRPESEEDKVLFDTAKGLRTK
ncbi:MAG: hotdog domain-containing protein [Bacteroidales bacterium]